MTASFIKNKELNPVSSKEPRYVEVTLSSEEAGYVRLLSAVLEETEEEVVTDLLVGRIGAPNAGFQTLRR
jgi:hypothetical protein